jgi:hypothetical protein
MAHLVLRRSATKATMREKRALCMKPRKRGITLRKGSLLLGMRSVRHLHEGT